MLWVLGYLFCVIAAFWLFQWSWRREFDAEIEHVIFFALSSIFGPVSLFIAGIVAVIEYVGYIPNRVVWKRRK